MINYSVHKKRFHDENLHGHCAGVGEKWHIFSHTHTVRSTVSLDHILTHWTAFMGTCILLFV